MCNFNNVYGTQYNMYMYSTCTSIYINEECTNAYIIYCFNIYLTILAINP